MISNNLRSNGSSFVATHNTNNKTQEINDDKEDKTARLFAMRWKDRAPKETPLLARYLGKRGITPILFQRGAVAILATLQR